MGDEIGSDRYGLLICCASAAELTPSESGLLLTDTLMRFSLGHGASTGGAKHTVGQADVTEGVSWPTGRRSLKNELRAGVMPGKYFGANAAWLPLAVITHDVLTALKRLALAADLLRTRPKRLRFPISNTAGRLGQNAPARPATGDPGGLGSPPGRRRCKPCRQLPEMSSGLSTDLRARFSKLREPQSWKPGLTPPLESGSRRSRARRHRRNDIFS
jgi:hypothetical protein